MKHFGDKLDDGRSPRYSSENCSVSKNVAPSKIVSMGPSIVARHRSTLFGSGPVEMPCNGFFRSLRMSPISLFLDFEDIFLVFFSFSRLFDLPSSFFPLRASLQINGPAPVQASERRAAHCHQKCKNQLTPCEHLNAHCFLPTRSTPVQWLTQQQWRHRLFSNLVPSFLFSFFLSFFFFLACFLACLLACFRFTFPRERLILM